MLFDPLPFDLASAVIQWLKVVGSLAGLVLAVTLIVSLAARGRRGPVEVFRQIAEGFSEMFGLSMRRVWALALLTIKEAVRRKSLLVFVVFTLLFMFGGWFLSSPMDRPELQVKVYISFVLTAISWLILPVALLLSCWGLPEDIKLRTLHTVVTKPARRNEIIMGRMLGFTCVGTLVLAVMGAVGYIWVVRQVPEQAQGNLICRVPAYGTTLRFLNRAGQPDKGYNVGDVWDFRRYIEGATKCRAIWNFENVSPEMMVDFRDEQSGETVQRLILESRFEAFRSHKGLIGKGLLCELSFVRNTREQAARALGGTPGFGQFSSAVGAGNFNDAAGGLTRLADGLNRSMLKPTDADYGLIAAGFRQYADLMRPFVPKHTGAPWLDEIVLAAEGSASAADKANSTELAQSFIGLSKLFAANSKRLAELVVDIRVALPIFDVKEFNENILVVDREMSITTLDETTQTEVTKDIDLFDDIVHGGTLRIDAICVDAEQYLGMARPDLFIRLPNRHFFVGFAKSIAGIWLMMVLVVVLGVTAGSLLSGQVAMFLVFALLVVGQGFREFLKKIVAGQNLGGGVFESMIRMINHMNLQTELTPGVLTNIVKFSDRSIDNSLWLAFQVIPDFSYFSRTNKFLPNGFDVDWASTLLPSVAITVGYLLPCIVAGYYCLKLRELEQK